jgi:hypothetical protein
LPKDVTSVITKAPGRVTVSNHAAVLGRNPFRSRQTPRTVEPIIVSSTTGIEAAKTTTSRAFGSPVHWLQYSPNTHTTAAP